MHERNIHRKWEQREFWINLCFLLSTKPIASEDTTAHENDIKRGGERGRDIVVNANESLTVVKKMKSNPTIIHSREHRDSKRRQQRQRQRQRQEHLRCHRTNFFLLPPNESWRQRKTPYSVITDVKRWIPPPAKFSALRGFNSRSDVKEYMTGPC